MNEKFYEKSWFMWVFLVIFAPVGIFLLWKYRRYNKNTRTILTTVFSILFIVEIISGNKTPQETKTANKQETKQVSVKTQSNKPSDDELLKNIIVSFDFQNVVDGKKKVVMKVNNNTDYLFDGTVDVNFKDDNGSSAGFDSLLEKKIAAKSSTVVILWGKENASKEDYKVNGSFSEVKQETKTKNDYELVLTQNGNDYNSFFVVIPKADKDSFINIIKEFRSKYTKDTLSNGFQIGFFLQENKADALKGDFKAAKGIYHANYNNDLSELYYKDTDETIEVK